MRRLVRPRALVHRGVVDAVGVVVHASSARDEGRARVLSLWAPGATVSRVAGAWLVRWASPRRVRAESAPGDVLVATVARGVALLATAPLDEAEACAVLDAGAQAGDVVRVRGAEAVHERVGGAEAVDAARWLDLGRVEGVAVSSLGDAPPPLTIVVDGAKRSREVLTGVTAASGGAFAKALASAMDSLSVGDGGEAAGAGGARPGLRDGLLRALLTVARWFGAGRAKQEPAQDAMTPPKGPSALDRWIARVDAWVASALRRSRIMDAFGARYAKYLDDMMGAFERGDLTEALRMAVPLGGAAGPRTDATPSLRIPSPRQALEIHVGPRVEGAGFASSLYDRIREVYRSTAERLEREGRIEEAAFVVAELLTDIPGAVALLERHGRHARAAELAEAAKLAPDLVVRQWMLAGDLARAVIVARRLQSFAVAVTRLAEREPALSLALRREWALATAAAGDLAAAIEIAWAAEPLRAMTDPWLDDAIALGGVGGARMLARKLALRPDALPAVLAALAALDLDTSTEGARARSAFATAIKLSPPTPASRVAARALVRSLVADGARGELGNGRALVLEVLVHMQDPLLRADLPVWPEAAVVAFAALATPRLHRVDHADVGTRPVHDAALLPDGRMALALGEAGVWIVARDGRPVARLDAPAHALVLSDHGDRCLAVARRGKRLRVARVDLAQRRAATWGEVELDAFATTFNGDGWVAATERDVVIIDALGERIEVLRPVVRVEAQRAVRDFARTPAAVALYADGDGGEVWAYDSAGAWSLRARHAALGAPPAASLAAFDAAGARLCVEARDGRWSLALHEAAPRPLDADLGNAAGPCLLVRALVFEGWVVVAIRATRAVEVTLYDRAALRPRWRATLAGASAVGLRVCHEHLVVCDDVGRVIAVGLAHGEVARDLRV